MAELKCLQRRINEYLLAAKAREEDQISCLAGETSNECFSVSRGEECAEGMASPVAGSAVSGCSLTD